MGETGKAAVGSRKEYGTTGLNQNGRIRIKSGSLAEETGKASNYNGVWKVTEQKTK